MVKHNKYNDHASTEKVASETASLTLSDIFYNTSSPSEPKHHPTSKESAGLGELFGRRTHILKTKLEVITVELFDRVRIRERNLVAIGDDQEKLNQILGIVDRQVRYHFRDSREKASFYDRFFDLEREKRDQDVECWRDVTQLMRDFLEVWEALEQGKSRSIFLDHV